jgi:3-oxoacyl-[acyl-carrier-protein] synthase-3
MKTYKPIKIIATGYYLPKAVSSEEIESIHNLSPGWSLRHSGVINRHHVTHESNGYMGAKAIEFALSNSELKLSDIDLIISAGATFDYPLPNQSSIIKSELENGNNYNIPTIDVDTTCLSFVTSFDIASRYLDGIQYKNIIIVSSEIGSNGLNPDNPETLTLFGDAAVAVIVSFTNDSESCLIKGTMNTYSEGVYHTLIKGGGNKYFFKDNPYDQELHSFKMDGTKLLKLARKEMRVFVSNFFEDLSFDLHDVDIIIPHQTSKIGLLLLQKILAVDESKIVNNLSSHGNCIAASIPLALHQAVNEKKLKRGNLCLLLGTSAGFSIGATLFRY